MKLLLSVVFGSLLVLSAVAWLLKPAPSSDGKTPLVWVSDNNPERQRTINRFNEMFPDLRLMLDPNNTGLQKIIVQSSSGVGPDLCDSYSGQMLQTLVESGIAWDVTEQAKAMGFSMHDKVWPAALGEISYRGRQYSYPCNFTVDILIYNKNVFDRFGVPYPTNDMTWEQFIELAQRVTRVGRSGRDMVHGVAGLNW